MCADYSDPRTPDIVGLSNRNTSEVFEDHLRQRLSGSLEDDLRRNYDPQVVLLTVNSRLIGHDGIRHSAKLLRDELPGAKFEFKAKRVCRDYALLVWRAKSDRFDAIEGSDTFVVERGKIKLQTIHYGLRS
jgi:hypothetical protein